MEQGCTRQVLKVAHLTHRISLDRCVSPYGRDLNRPLGLVLRSVLDMHVQFNFTCSPWVLVDHQAAPRRPCSVSAGSPRGLRVLPRDFWFVFVAGGAVLDIMLFLSFS